MSIEAMKQALEALDIGLEYAESELYENRRRYEGYMHLAPDDQAYVNQIKEAIASLRQAIEQAEKQEPVAWIDSDWHYQLHKKGMVVAHKNKSDVLIGNPQPFYTVPQPSPQTWVAITDEEFEQMLTDAKFTRSDLLMLGACVEDICNLVEAKLRSKNT